MILFGHLGLTLAAAGSLKRAAEGRGLKNFFQRVDYRILLLGSLLPDLADKPAAFFFKNIFMGASRLYGHTLLFSILLLLSGAYLWNRYKTAGGLVLALGAAFHQVLDGMWNSPATMLWPFLGWSFPAVERSDYLQYLIHKLTTDPYTYIPEAAGLAVMVYFTVLLARRKQLNHFIRTGKAGSPGI